VILNYQKSALYEENMNMRVILIFKWFDFTFSVKFFLFVCFCQVAQACISTYWSMLLCRFICLYTHSGSSQKEGFMLRVGVCDVGKLYISILSGILFLTIIGLFCLVCWYLGRISSSLLVFHTTLIISLCIIRA